MTARWTKTRRMLFHHGSTSASTKRSRPGNLTLMQISPETTPPKPSSLENCTGNLTLTGDIEGDGGTKELLDLKPTAI
jgi:hypothetical protein